MKTVSRIYTFLIFLFLYAPIVVLIVFSFNDSTTMSRSVWSGFSLKWYFRLFQDQMLLDALRNTLIIAVIAAVVSTVLGTAAAIGISGMNKWVKRVVMNVTNFPMVNPDIVTGVSLMLLFVAAREDHGQHFARHGVAGSGAHYVLPALCDPFRYAEAAGRWTRISMRRRRISAARRCPPSSGSFCRRSCPAS